MPRAESAPIRAREIGLPRPRYAGETKFTGDGAGAESPPPWSVTWASRPRPMARTCHTNYRAPVSGATGETGARWALKRSGARGGCRAVTPLPSVFDFADDGAGGDGGADLGGQALDGAGPVGV